MSEIESRKIYVAGEQGSPLASKNGAPVRIEEIWANYNRDNLFTDVDFPPTLSSVGGVGGDDARDVEVDFGPGVGSYDWMRAHEICKSSGLQSGPEFISTRNAKGELVCSELDVAQGGLGDCWFMAALAELTKKPEYCNFAIPVDNFNGFDDDKYCGAFHFRFYVVADDKWVDVVVDDLLPVIGGAPSFAKIKTDLAPDRTVFWVALAEKAYAKLHGSYKGIEGGFPSQALENLCGGFAECFACFGIGSYGLNYDPEGPLSDKYTSFKKFLLGYVNGNNFMALGTYSKADQTLPDIADGYGNEGKGLHGPHAYSILDVQEVKAKGGAANSEPKVLIQLRNPWGRGEWTGAFSDSDDAGWAELEKDLRGVKREEGVFWIELNDFLKYGSVLEVCHFGLTDGTQLSTVKGTWPAALQGLPDPEDADDYLRLTTAYRFEVKQGAIGAKYADVSGGKALICFALVLQGHRAGLKPDPRFSLNIYKVNDPNTPIKDMFPEQKTRSAGREASGWLFVDPGTYVLVPALRTAPKRGETKAFPPEFEGKELTYAVRVFAENKVEFEELRE